VGKPLLVVCSVGALALVGALVHRGRSPQPANARTPTAASTRHPRRPAPPRPARIAAALPGALLIADRGNDRMLVVDSHRRILWRFPTARDRKLGRTLHFDDDTFVEPAARRSSRTRRRTTPSSRSTSPRTGSRISTDGPASRAAPRGS